MLNKQLVIWMLQDLTQADNDRLERDLLAERATLQDSFITKQREAIDALRRKNADMNELNKSITEHRDQLEIDLKDKTADHQRAVRARRAWMYAALGMFGYAILSK